MDGKEKKKALADETADLKELCRVWGPFEADLIKSFLEGHGISSIVRGRAVPFVYPLTVDGMAELKVFVQEKDLEMAKELLASRPVPDEESGSGETR